MGWSDSQVSAYGLTRCDGGTIITRYVHSGQRDSITAERFDDFRTTYRGESATRYALPFVIAAERFSVLQTRLLSVREEFRQTMERDLSDGNDDVSGL